MDAQQYFGVSDFLADDEKHALSITRDLVSKIYENKSKNLNSKNKLYNQDLTKMKFLG